MKQSDRPHIVIVAAENGALDGAKVGGMADVIKEIPRPLFDRGLDVTVITPSHGFLQNRHDAVPVSASKFHFAGEQHEANVYELIDNAAAGEKPHPQATTGPRQLILHHALLAADTPGDLYVSDPPDRPFARDASRFACFCAATAAFLENDINQAIDILHLHDWHTGFLSILRRSGQFPGLASIRSVFTIHNLAYQGIRPISDDESSFLAWYPDIEPNRETIGDPRWPWCVNPMAAAIRLSDAVHVVSSSYAEDIQHPDKPEVGVGTGGCGLEKLLADANAENRLSGILNGCHYDATDESGSTRIGWQSLNTMLSTALMSSETNAVIRHPGRALKILEQIPDSGPAPIVTSVGRLTDQKVGLLMEPVAEDTLAIDAVLDGLGTEGLLIMLGSGDPETEQLLTEVAERHDNFLLLLGFSEPIADAMYRSGDLFLMPSTFEPCGISQMLAMRAGQPCLVNSVGGLKDTIKPGVNGFAFTADTRAAQAQALVTCARSCFSRYSSDSYPNWKRFSISASQARFLWRDTVNEYLRRLYAPAINVDRLDQQSTSDTHQRRNENDQRAGV